MVVVGILDVYKMFSCVETICVIPLIPFTLEFACPYSSSSTAGLSCILCSYFFPISLTSASQDVFPSSSPLLPCRLLSGPPYHHQPPSQESCAVSAAVFAVPSLQRSGRKRPRRSQGQVPSTIPPTRKLLFRMLTTGPVRLTRVISPISTPKT